MVNLKKILFPTDFSEYSAVAQDYCISIAKKFDAQIYILHVIEIFLPDPDYLSIYGDIDKLYKEFEAEAKKYMTQLVNDKQFASLKLQSHITIGKPFLEIIKYAKETNIDLIVMGSHGKSGLNHILFGSTADKVVTKAPCPVLTVKHPEHKFVMP